MNIIFKKPYYPILFAIYPVLFLYAFNIGVTTIDMIYRSFFVVTISTLIIYLILVLIIKNKNKAALMTFLCVFLFFMFGYLSQSVQYFSEEILGVDKYVYIFINYILILYISCYIVIKSNKSFEQGTYVFNQIVFLLIIIPITQIGYHFYLQQRIDQQWVDEYSEVLNLDVDSLRIEAEKSNLPDIYYIILDGYARDDILNEFYEYDNNDFIEFLSDKGFFVARESRTNYNRTLLTLASTLNMTYLDEIAEEVGRDQYDRRPLMNLVGNNNVSDIFNAIGYSIIDISSGYHNIYFKNADIYLKTENKINEFENTLMNFTPLSYLLNYLLERSQYEIHREKVLSVFDGLKYTYKINSQKFVFAHIFAPHPPFVFDKNGGKIIKKRPFNTSDGSMYHNNDYNKQERYRELYVDYLQFVNHKMKETIDVIINNSESRPIIIIQSDHGPRMLHDWNDPKNTNMKEWSSILNAFYIRGCDYEYIPDNITSVNTFRLILNKNFGSDINLLEDKVYFTTFNRPYDFIDVTKISINK